MMNDVSCGSTASAALRETGFTLLESLVAAALAGFMAMGVASMLGLAIASSGTSEAVTELTALGVDRLEFLASLPFSDPRLGAGGSLSTSYGGYSVDLGEGNSPTYVRWEITDESLSLKRIRVVAGRRDFNVSGDREVAFETYRILTQ